MFKTRVNKGDKVIVVRGDASRFIDEATKQPLIGTVLKVDRLTGHALLDMPRPKKEKKGERQTPLKGVEQWKTARYNPKTGEAGGLKIVKRPVHVSNLEVVEKAPKREFGNK